MNAIMPEMTDAIAEMVENILVNMIGDISGCLVHHKVWHLISCSKMPVGAATRPEAVAGDPRHRLERPGPAVLALSAAVCGGQAQRPWYPRTRPRDGGLFLCVPPPL